MRHDTIPLTLPAAPEYARTVRMTASALVSRTNLTYEGVEDVRIAAEEVFVYASECAGHEGQVTFEFTLGADCFEIRVRLGNEIRATDEEDERRTAYATFILQSVCDRFEVYTDLDGEHLRIVKNLPVELGDEER